MALGKNLDPLDSNRADFKSTPSAKGGDFQIYLCTPNRLLKPFSLFEIFLHINNYNFDYFMSLLHCFVVISVMTTNDKLVSLARRSHDHFCSMSR